MQSGAFSNCTNCETALRRPGFKIGYERWPDWKKAAFAVARRSNTAGPTVATALFAVIVLAGCTIERQASPTPEPCSETWFAWVENRVPTGDNAGHGPNPGSAEWKSVIEFRLGIRDDPAVPDVDSDAWCGHIDALVRD